MQRNRPDNRRGLGEIARLFLKLGTIGFGGPAAHIAMMEDEVVRRRGWLSKQRFLDLIGATNLIPGPNSTEMAIHIGLTQAGWRGLIVAGTCFIFPAVVIVLALAWAYVRYGTAPQAVWILYGVKPVIIAIVVQALWSLGTKAVKGLTTGVVGAAVLALSFLGVSEVLLLFAGAFLVMVLENLRRGRAGQTAAGFLVGPLLFAGTGAQAATGAVAGVSVSLLKLTGFFLKIGSILFGSGYVLLVFLRADLVERWHWLSDQQLIDAVAIGQFTPGPVFTTATFIGYLIAGWPGGILATIAIFFPSFVLVAASSPLIPRLRNSPWASGFLDGANVAALALMAMVTFQLGRAAVIDWFTALLLLLATIGVFRLKVNSAWLVLGGGAVSLAYRLFG